MLPPTWTRWSPLHTTRRRPLSWLRYNPELGQDEVEKAGEALRRLKIALYPILGELSQLSPRAAYRYGLTMYDASYLSLSQHLNTELYTADGKVIEKTKGNEKVVHIKDYPGGL